MNPLTSDQVPMFNYLNSKSRSYLTRHLPNGYCRAIAKYGPKNLAKVSVVEQAIITPVLRCLVQMINCNLPDYKCICRIELVLTTVYHTVWVTHCELATTALSLSLLSVIVTNINLSGEARSQLNERKIHLPHSSFKTFSLSLFLVLGFVLFLCALAGDQCCKTDFFKWAISASFLIYFRLLKQMLQFSQKIYVKKSPSSIHMVMGFKLPTFRTWVSSHND